MRANLLVRVFSSSQCAAAVIAIALAVLFCLATKAQAADLLVEITGGNDPVCAAFDPRRPEFAVGRASDKMIDVWSATDGKQLRTLKSHDTNGILDLAYSPDGLLLASAGQDKTVRLWYAGNGRLIHILKGHQGDVTGVDFSPDGDRVASVGTDKRLILWDVSSGAALRDIEAHSDVASVVRFSPDGKLLATAGRDLAVRLWEAKSANWLRTMRGPVLPITCLAFTPDGKRLACGDEDGRVYLFQVEDGRTVKTMGQHTWGGRPNWPIQDIAFYPEGQQIITAAGDGTVKIWDVTSGKFVHTLRAHVGGVTAMALSRDGKLLVTAGHSEPVKAAEGAKLWTSWGREDKNTIKVWDAESARLPLSHPADTTPIISAPKIEGTRKR